MNIELQGDRIVDLDTGNVAVSYYQPRFFAQPIPGTRRSYSFADRHGLCMSWVSAEDVPTILSMVGGCCGRKKPGVFRLTTDLNGVKRWIEASR